MQAKRRNPAQHRGERKPDIDTSLVTYGRNSVMEFLRAGKVRQIYLKSGRHDERLQEILEEAKSRAVPIKEVEEEELDSMSGGVVHQGIAALLFPYEYQDMNAVIKKWEGKDPIFILFDGVEDVRNLGAHDNDKRPFEVGFIIQAFPVHVCSHNPETFFFQILQRLLYVADPADMMKGFRKSLKKQNHVLFR